MKYAYLCRRFEVRLCVSLRNLSVSGLRNRWRNFDWDFVLAQQWRAGGNQEGLQGVWVNVVLEKDEANSEPGHTLATGLSNFYWLMFFSSQCSRRNWRKTWRVTPLGTSLSCSWLLCRWAVVVSVFLMFATKSSWNWEDSCLISAQTKRADPSAVVDYEKIDEDARVSS